MPTTMDEACGQDADEQAHERIRCRLNQLLGETLAKALEGRPHQTDTHHKEVDQEQHENDSC